VPRIEGEAVIPGMLEWCRRADEGENGAVIPGMAPSFDGERGEGVGEGEDGGTFDGERGWRQRRESWRRGYGRTVHQPNL
jgi:hypothetical protein